MQFNMKAKPTHSKIPLCNTLRLKVLITSESGQSEEVLNHHLQGCKATIFYIIYTNVANTQNILLQVFLTYCVTL